MLQTAMWLIPIAPFIIGIATTWSLRQAFEEMVWFNVAYALTLGAVYLAEVLGYGFVSTSPTGAGGAMGLVAGFVALGVCRYRWKKRKYEEAVAKAAEQRRIARERKAQGLSPTPPADNSLVTSAFRLAGSLERSRRQAMKRRAEQQRTTAGES
ncbi:MAG: hypothetical protein M9890_01895 [Thermomicrobiales bacterium]|nr:hypothetical protein [Thermomicrobiales bacterium]